MSRRRKKKTRTPKRELKTPSDVARPAPIRSPLTEAWKGRMMQGAVRRAERQPGRSS